MQKSTLQFPRDADDWVLYNKQVPEKLEELQSQGYTLVIFRSVTHSHLAKHLPSILFQEDYVILQEAW